MLSGRVHPRPPLKRALAKAPSLRCAMRQVLADEFGKAHADYRDMKMPNWRLRRGPGVGATTIIVGLIGVIEQNADGVGIASWYGDINAFILVKVHYDDTSGTRAYGKGLGGFESTIAITK
jgi:hypothetical protein